MPQSPAPSRRRRAVAAVRSGEQLSLAGRISHGADAAEVLERRLGISGAVATIRDRRGTHFDPAVVDAIGTNPSTLFDGIADDSIDELLDRGAGGAATPE